MRLCRTSSNVSPYSTVSLGIVGLVSRKNGHMHGWEIICEKYRVRNGIKIVEFWAEQVYVDPWRPNHSLLVQDSNNVVHVVPEFIANGSFRQNLNEICTGTGSETGSKVNVLVQLKLKSSNCERQFVSPLEQAQFMFCLDKPYVWTYLSPLPPSVHSAERDVLFFPLRQELLPDNVKCVF